MQEAASPVVLGAYLTTCTVQIQVIAGSPRGWEGERAGYKTHTLGFGRLYHRLAGRMRRRAL